MKSFIEQFMVPRVPEPEGLAPITYDPVLQLNVMADGTPAIHDLDWLAASGTTVSTAGSKTHFDD